MSDINWQLSWVVFNLITVTTWGVIAIKSPVILDKGSEETFKEGDKLLLKCEGDEPLIWTHSHLRLDDDSSSDSYDTNDTVLTASMFAIAKRTKRHSTTLILERLGVSDSGFFFCRYKDPKYAEYLDTFKVIVVKSDVERAGMSEGAKAVLFSLIITCVVLLVGLLIFRACKWKRKRARQKKNLEDGDEDEMERWLEKKQDNRSVQDSVKLSDLERNLSKQGELRPFSVIDEVISSKWEFPRERLRLGDQLGAGAFGRVVKAEAVGLNECESSTTVAVKMIKPEADESQLNALIVELKIMANLGSHVNVVNFLGACTKDFPVAQELFLIVEYCERGSLINYIRRHKDRFVNQLDIDVVDPSSREFIDRASKDLEEAPGESCDDTSATGEGEPTVTTTDLLCWAFQIARGMEYLASRKVIHGDLATRNVLLTDSSNVVKLCDFGLAKEMYRDYNYIMSTKSGKFPIKWMAIESIYYGELSTESDCWSFGVVLWELFSLGKIPYSGIKADEDLIKRIDRGYRLEKPVHASSSVYNMMLECWAEDKEKRPTFSGLVNRIGCMMGEMLRDHYVELNAQYVRDNEETMEGSSKGDNIYRILSRTKQDVDTCGYLKPIQLSKSAEPRQDASQEPQSQVSAQRQQQQTTLTPGMINEAQGTNFYVQDPTFSLPRNNSTTSTSLV